MRKNFFLWSLFVVALAAMCSCTSGSDDLLSKVPSDTEVVLIGDVKTVFESAGGTLTDSKVTMPSWLTEITDGDVINGKDLDEVNDFIKNSGVNLDECMLAMKDKWGTPLIVVALDDQKKFVNYIEEKKYSEEDSKDGIVFYKEEDSGLSSSYVAIKDSYAYLMSAVYYKEGSFDPVKGICRIIDEAKDSPFSKTSMAKYISGHVLGVSFKMPRYLCRELKASGLPSDLVDLYNGYVCLKGSLDSDDVEMEAKVFDENGKVKSMKDFSKMMNLNAKVSNKALSFMGKDESLVCATSLKDFKWSAYLDMIADMSGMPGSSRRQLGMVEDYLKNIDGTVAFGFGFTNGLESIYTLNYGRHVMNEIAFTLVVETKDGMAKKLMGDLEDLMMIASIPYEGSASKGYFAVEIPGEGTISEAAEGNFLVVSNHKIKQSKDNPTVKAFDFDDYLAAVACKLDKENKLMKDLGLNNDVMLSYYGDVKDMELTMKLEVKGGKGAGVLEKIGNMILTASKTDFSPYYD